MMAGRRAPCALEFKDHGFESQATSSEKLRILLSTPKASPQKITSPAPTPRHAYPQYGGGKGD